MTCREVGCSGVVSARGWCGKHYRRWWREENRERDRQNNRRWYEANRERKREQSRSLYLANREKRREQQLRWRENNREKDKENMRRWYLANHEENKAKRYRWHLDHPDRSRENRQRWQAMNPEKLRKYARERRALKIGRNKGLLIDDYVSVLYADVCSYCGRPVEAIDHIESFAQGGLETWDNLTAACRLCNGSKFTKSLLGFLAIRSLSEGTRQEL